MMCKHACARARRYRPSKYGQRHLLCPQRAKLGGYQYKQLLFNQWSKHFRAAVSCAFWCAAFCTAGEAGSPFPYASPRAAPAHEQGSMQCNTLETALLDQLDELIDTPWSDGAARLPDTAQDANAVNPPSTMSGYRQLAPAPVDMRQPNPRATARQPSLPPTVPEPLREQDRLLPMANVARLMTSELPKDAKVSRDAKLLMQEMVSEFICFITSEANEFSAAENHKAITQEDLLSALDSLDLGCYVPVMEGAIHELPKVRPCRADAGSSAPHNDPMSRKRGINTFDPQSCDGSPKIQHTCHTAPQTMRELGSSTASLADSISSAETTRLASPCAHGAVAAPPAQVTTLPPRAGAAANPFYSGNIGLDEMLARELYRPVVATAVPNGPAPPMMAGIHAVPVQKCGPSPLSLPPRALGVQHHSPVIVPGSAPPLPVAQIARFASPAAEMPNVMPMSPQMNIAKPAMAMSSMPESGGPMLALPIPSMPTNLATAKHEYLRRAGAAWNPPPV